MGIIEWTGAVVGGIAINIIASELFAWGPKFSEWLARCAVRRLPSEMQERMREEWAGHLDALHPLSRTLTAMGFVCAAGKMRASFEREAKGALTLREWLRLKPITVIVITSKAARAMGRKLRDIDMWSASDVQPMSFEFGREDAMIRMNLMAKGKQTLRRLRAIGPIKAGKEFEFGGLSEYSTNSFGDLVIERESETLVFKIRSTIRH